MTMATTTTLFGYSRRPRAQRAVDWRRVRSTPVMANARRRHAGPHATRRSRSRRPRSAPSAGARQPSRCAGRGSQSRSPWPLFRVTRRPASISSPRAVVRQILAPTTAASPRRACRTDLDSPFHWVRMMPLSRTSPEPTRTSTADHHSQPRTARPKPTQGYTHLRYLPTTAVDTPDIGLRVIPLPGRPRAGPVTARRRGSRPARSWSRGHPGGSARSTARIFDATPRFCAQVARRRACAVACT